MPAHTSSTRLNEQIATSSPPLSSTWPYAVHYDAETLPRLAPFFYRQALEERNHALMMVRYLLDADAHLAVPGVAAPRPTFADVVAPVALALDQERRVTEADQRARGGRARGRRLHQRAVHAVVHQGAGRGGRDDVRPPARGRARSTTTRWSSRSSSRASSLRRGRRPQPRPRRAPSELRRGENRVSKRQSGASGGRRLDGGVGQTAYVRAATAVAGAIAFAAVALLPLSSAGAHPLDCTTTVTAAASPVSWTLGEDGCANEAADVAVDNRAADAGAVRLERRKDRRGRLTQVGHEPLLNRGMNAAIAAQRGLRVHRQPDRRRPCRDAAGRHHGGRHLGSVEPRNGAPGRSTPSPASRRASCACGARRTS